MNQVLLATALAAVLASGCLAEIQDDARRDTAACDLIGDPRQTPASAPAQGGPGARRITVTLPDDGSAAGDRVAVVAWWRATSGEVEVVRLRTAGSPTVTFAVPADIPVALLTGRSVWTNEGHVGPGSSDATVLLTSGLDTGSLEGDWGALVAEGVSGASWQPNDLPWAEGGRLGRLERAELTLTWTNGPQGGADFGIAVGPNGESGFHYTNREYQTSVGGHTESRVLEAADLAQLGWDDATRPQAGPSVSTGGFAVSPIPYTLAWKATFAVDPALADRCLDLGSAVAVDATSGSEAPAAGSMIFVAGPAASRRTD